MLPEGSPAWIQHALWSNGLGIVTWAPLGTAWALGKTWPVARTQLRVGAAITGHAAGQPWTVGDFLTPADGSRMLVRSVDVHGVPFGDGYEVAANAAWDMATALNRAITVALSEASDILRA